MAETFGGIINREVKDSTPWWPEPNLPDKDLPNIVTVLLDDTGFAHLGCLAPLSTLQILTPSPQGGCGTTTFTQPPFALLHGLAC